MSYGRPCNRWSVVDALQRTKKDGHLLLLAVSGDPSYPWVEVVTASPGASLPDLNAMGSMSWEDYKAELALHPGVKTGNSFPLDGLSACFDCPRCDATYGRDRMLADARYRYLRDDVASALARIMSDCRPEDREEIRGSLKDWLETGVWPRQRSQHDSIEAAMRAKRAGGEATGEQS